MTYLKKIDQYTIKEINKQNLLNTFEKQDYLTANDMMNITGLTTVTTNAIIKDLLLENWIEESHYAESSGGRKPMVYKFNKNRNLLLQISISKKSIHITILNLRKEKIVFINKDIKIKGNQELVNELSSMLNDKEIKPYISEILAVAINVPGVIDHASATLLFSSPLSVSDFNFSKFVEDFMERTIPVYVFKRVDGLLMEAIADHDAHEKTAYILFDDGLGLSVSGPADRISIMKQGSELGHMVVKTCSGKVILGEFYRDDYLLEMNNKLNKENKFDSFKSLLNYLSRKDDLEENAFVKEVESEVALVCANVMNLFAPDRLIIGGGVVEYLSAERIQDNMSKDMLAPFLNNLSFDIASVSYEKLIEGTLNYILSEHVFKIPF